MPPLWIAHTYLMDCWESTPRIGFLSPEPASGKTRALEVTEPRVPRAIYAVNVTSAYLFRKVSDPEGLPTILYDEIDTVFGPKAKDNEDIRGMINAGHRNGTVAGRCVIHGKTVETEELPAYCAVMMAGLNDLPDTIMSRCVVVRMKKRAPSETVKPWRLRLDAPVGLSWGSVWPTGQTVLAAKPGTIGRRCRMVSMTAMPMFGRHCLPGSSRWWALASNRACRDNSGCSGFDGEGTQFGCDASPRHPGRLQQT